MPEELEADPTDAGTPRPNVKPLKKVGTKFKPMKLKEWDSKITLPEGVDPANPMDLFGLYYTNEMMETITKHTNLYERYPEDPELPHARAHKWTPVTKQDMYLFFAIRVYMTLYPEKQLNYYWDTHPLTPSHPFTQYIGRDTFQELRMRYRVAPPGMKETWDRVQFFL